MDVIGTVLASTPTADILVFIDTDVAISLSTTQDFLRKLVNDWPVLKKRIVMGDHVVTLADCIFFDIHDHFSIEEMPLSEASKRAIPFLTSERGECPQWEFLVCVDTSASKSRVYLRINHAYADGYTVIKMLSGQDLSTSHVRSTSIVTSVYNSLTTLPGLLFQNVSVVRRCASQPFIVPSLCAPSLFACDSLDLRLVKEASKNAGICVSAFLYALMLCAHSRYVGKSTLLGLVTISTSDATDKKGLQVTPLIFEFSTEDKPALDLLRGIHTQFQGCQTSCYIPLVRGTLSMIGAVCSKEAITNTTSYGLHNEIDFVFGSLIGPNADDVRDTTGIPVVEIGYVIAAGPVSFNTISYRDTISVHIASRGDKITDQEKYKHLIGSSYKMLLAACSAC